MNRHPPRTPLGQLSMLAVNVAVAENELVSRKALRDHAIYELYRGGYTYDVIASAAEVTTDYVDGIVERRLARLAERDSGA